MSGRSAPRRHRLGVNLWLWGRELVDRRPADLLGRVSSMGFDFVSVPLEPGLPWTAREVLHGLRREGLGATVAAVMGPGMDLAAGPFAGATAKYLEDCIDFASELGAPLVEGPLYGGLGGTPSLTAHERSRRVGAIQERLAELAEHASRRGVRLAVEPFSRFSSDLVNTGRQALDLVAGVPRGSLGVVLDTFHMNIEEADLPAAVRFVGNRLVGLHVAGSDRGVPGEDHIDWSGIGSALEELGPTWLCLESFATDDPVMGRITCAWRSFAASQDEFARRSLAFLHRLSGTTVAHG